MYQTKYNFADEDFCWKYLIDETFHNEKAIYEYTENLYHYTTPQGLVGILENQKLWATEYSFLNDVSELNYGMKLSIDLLEKEIQKNSNITLDKYLMLVKKAMENKQEINDFYITSFSEHKDLLSQWKGYGQNGQGFSLGFDFKEFTRWKREDFLDIFIYIQPVIYNAEEQKNVLTKIYKNLINNILTLENNKLLKDKKINSIASCTVNFMKLKSIFFKSDSFQEENEWRIVYQNSGNVEVKKKKIKFRFNESKIIPYLELDILPTKSILPIKEIILGAKNNMSEIDKIIDYIYTNLEKKDLIPEMKLSNIPLR